MSAMAEKTISEIAKLCADCGTCQSACPVYQAELSEPNSPRGKVNLVEAIDDGRLAANAAQPQAALPVPGLRRLQQACPNGVEFNSLMITHRNRISDGSRIPRLKKAVLFFTRGWSCASCSGCRGCWRARRSKRALSLPTFQPADLKRVSGGDRKKEYDVLLFPGCVLTYLYPRKIVEIKSLLEKQGFSVLYPAGLRCCGFPYLSQGWGKKFAS